MLPNAASFENYGGKLENYKPISDPTTDLDAKCHNEMSLDVANMTRTAIKAYVVFKYNSGDEAPFVIDEYNSVFGDSQSVYPSIQRNSVGKYEITFPLMITDELGKEIAINLKACWLNFSPASDSSTLVVKFSKITDPNSVSIVLSEDLSTDDKLSLFVV